MALLHGEKALKNSKSYTLAFRRFSILPIAAGFLIANAGHARADDMASLHQLIESSDFVGIVVADPSFTSAPAARESVFIYSAEPFKGALTHLTPTQYSYVNAERTASGNYPAWFSEKAEYLVFLNIRSKDAQPYWTTRAAYRVDYRPDASGEITGRIFGGAMTISEARKLVKEESVTGLQSPSAESRISPLLTAHVSPEEPPSTYEESLKLAKTLIAGIKQGTTRGGFEKIFRQQDGGAMSTSDMRYYFGNEVMIHVPFDATGGGLKPSNRINGPITIRRDMMHCD